MTDFGPWAVLVISIILLVAGLIIAALGVGYWGLRRALSKGRYCPRCHLWGTELEIALHDCTAPERE